MNQADVSKLVSKLRVKVLPKHRNLPGPKGPEGRIDKLRKTVTGLIKFERIELNYNRADEARQYAERLISEAIRHGDCHKPTMDTADFWLLEKELVHKLFKVLVPRYETSNLSYTRMYNAPRLQYGRTIDKVVLELRGNPFPDLLNNKSNNKLLIQNVLLDAAKNDYRQTKIAEMAKNIGKDIGTKQNTDSKLNEAPEKPNIS
ncbi:39S ribosomal protein L17, mitochondrial [Spodoptera frugiperda]|uniref:Large ribosomal subunit protein bL17m n=1 Tax=Spodoptera frugiperda TaxID=7108 RepID=A0A9R0D214_SPOFR|nr:39S ribosomal protein L17, mitochondrial [Spodoptera frugiperda]